MLERLFQLQQAGTTIRTEVIAGISTFLAMSYILIINPDLLSMTGMDKGAVFTATCIAAAIGSLIMGLYANYPVALAPGMGLNAFFTFGVVKGMGYTWEIALGAVFISGLLFLLISIFKLRQWIIESIPVSMRYSIAAGIGFFLALIALKSVGLVVDHPATLVSLGSITSTESLFTLGGFLLIGALAYRGILGSVMIVMIAITAAAFFLGKVEYNGFMSAPPSIAPTLLKMDIAGAFDIGMITVIFAFLFVDLFDTSGTLIAVSQQGNLLDKDGNLPRLGKAMTADSVATIAGAGLGTSNTTSYIESGVGIAAGGRTGLTAVVTGILFLLALFFAPIASMVPSYATAPALLFVAVLMSSNLARIDWKDITEALPALVTVLMMPLSFSIAEGIAVGFICYAFIKVLSGRFEDMTIGVYIISAVFIAKFLFI